MLRNEKLKNSDLRVQLDKLRLAREIESPSYQLAQLKFSMEREQLKLQEIVARQSKDLLRVK